MRKIYPVPELVLDDYIRVDDTRSGTEGSMDNSKRIMRVPLMDTPACRHVRAHEMAHGKYSPEAPMAPKGIPEMLVQRAEDMRMNIYCRKQGLHEAMDAPIIPDAEVWRRLLFDGYGNKDKVGTLTAGISTYNTGDWSAWVKRSAATREDIEFIESLWDDMGDEPTWEDTIATTRRVAEYLDIDPEDGGHGKGGGEGGKGGGEGDGESDGESKAISLDGDIMDEMVDKSLEAEAAEMAKTPFEKGRDLLDQCKERAVRYGRRGEAVIGTLKIVKRPMTQRLAPSKFKSRAKVPTDRGMVPKYMNRYCSDKVIFQGRGKKRDNGGTIIIDCSGSMAITDEQIDDIMRVCPLGTIATYNGKGDGGQLWIIAEKGKRATGTLRPHYGGNVVDYQSLAWAVKQAGPYYWVCDGMVSGSPDLGDGRAVGAYGEVFGQNIFDLCIDLVEKHGIIMVPELSELPDVMRKTL